MNRHLGLVALLVREYDEAIAFYVDKLGFQLVEDSMQAPDKRWVVVAPAASTETQLLLAKAADAEQDQGVGNQAGGRVFLFLRTDDFWRDHKAMSRKGVRFLEEPRTETYGTVAVFEDLYGNKWDLIEETAR